MQAFNPIRSLTLSPLPLIQQQEPVSADEPAAPSAVTAAAAAATTAAVAAPAPVSAVDKAAAVNAQVCVVFDHVNHQETERMHMTMMNVLVSSRVEDRRAVRLGW